MYGWYEPEAKGFRLFLIRLGTVCALLGMACLLFVVAVSLIGVIAA